MGKPLVFYPGQKIGWLEVLDPEPLRSKRDPYQRKHNLWRVWCHYCQSEALVRASSINPKGKKPNQTCGCRIGGRRGAKIQVDSKSAFRNAMMIRKQRYSGQVAPFINPKNPKEIIVTDPAHPNFDSFLQIYTSSLLIGIYDEESTSYDLREDYIWLLKSHLLAGTIDLQKGLDALESIIYKNRRKRGE